MTAVDKSSEQSARSPQSLTLQQLAQRLDAAIAPEHAQRAISGFATLLAAESGDISFVASDKMLPLAAQSNAGALVAPAGLEIPGAAVIHVPEIWEAVCQLIAIFRPAPPVATGIDPSAQVGGETTLGDGAALGPNVVIGNACRIGRRVQIGAGATIGDGVVIGDDSLIHPGVHILHHVTLGQRVIVQSGAVIGSDGFKFEMVNGAWKKIPQVGTIIIEDDVEIGANAAIDRAFLDETRIGRGTKIDNLVQIAHNVQIGAHSLLCAHVGIAGSAKLGQRVVFAGKVGVKDGITIGDNVQAAATAAIKDDIPDGQFLIGQPAIPIAQWSRIYAATRKSPETLKRLKALENKVEKLEKGE